jgi:hypothetical protein
LTTPEQKEQGQFIQASVMEWLLDSDPSIRWQVMHDLTHAPPAAVAAERARVGTEGWGAALLALQELDGTWAGEAWNQGWNSTMHALTLLREMGLDPTSEAAQQAVSRVREKVRWRGWEWDGSWHGLEHPGNPFFAGEVEPCINGQTGAAGVYFRQDISRIIEYLLKDQMADGGWNCEQENGSTRGSFNTTICVLEALLEYELAGGDDPRVTEARLRGQEFLLERRLFHRLSTGEVIERDEMDGSDWRRFTFPNWWHYDILRGLDYLRRAAVTPDEHVDEAIELVESKRAADGRWLLDKQYPGRNAIEMGEADGQPSRWITLRAMRVLRWYEVR